MSVLVRIPSALENNLLPFGLVSEITWRLRASTFVIMKETAGLPTVQQASTSQFVTKCTVFGQRQAPAASHEYLLLTAGGCYYWTSNWKMTQYQKYGDYVGVKGDDGFDW